MTTVKYVVVDANILIRAVLGQKVRQLFVAFSDKVAFITPQVYVDDAYRYLPNLLLKRGVDPQQALLFLQELMTIIQVIDDVLLEDYQLFAKKLLRQRDENDWPILAVALLLNCPIWTEDQDFFGVGVATWTTANIGLFLES